MNRSRIAILFVLFATISAACLIPREMAGYILPPTASITPTESLTPPPSLTPFLPLTMTPPPAITPSTTTEISPSPSVSPITTLTGTITVTPGRTSTYTLQGATQLSTSSKTPTLYRSPTPTKKTTTSVPTFTKTPPGPTATPSRTRTAGPTFTRTFTRTPGPTLTASPTYNGSQVTPSGPVSAMQLINAMNQLRVANGYPALRVNAILMGTSQWTAEYMAANHSNGHIGNVSGRIAAAGFGNGATVFATENWARGFTTLSQIMSAWADPLHMIPATNPNLTDIGAGVATGPWGPYYILHAAYSVGPTVAPSRTPTRTFTRTPTRTATPTFTLPPPTSTIPPTGTSTNSPEPTEVPSLTPTETIEPSGFSPGTYSKVMVLLPIINTSRLDFPQIMGFFQAGVENSIFETCERRRT